MLNQAIAAPRSRENTSKDRYHWMCETPMETMEGFLGEQNNTTKAGVEKGEISGRSFFNPAVDL